MLDTTIDRQAIANTLALDIHVTELAGAQAISETLRLSLGVLDATRDAKVHMTTSFAVLEQLHLANGFHLEGLKRTAAGSQGGCRYRACSQDQASGPTDKPPPSFFPDDTEGHLKSAPAQAA